MTGYWWQIKRYGEEPIRVTAEQAEKVQEAILQNADRYVRVNGELIALKSISAVEETTERFASPFPELPAGKGEGHGAGRIRDDGSHGAVSYIWVKKRVNHKDFKDYASRPGWRVLDHENKIVAFRYVSPEPLPYHLEECSSYEVERLERTLQAHR